MNFHTSGSGVQSLKRHYVVDQDWPLWTGWHDFVAKEAGEHSQRRIEGCRFTLEIIQYWAHFSGEGSSLL